MVAREWAPHVTTVKLRVWPAFLAVTEDSGGRLLFATAIFALRRAVSYAGDVSELDVEDIKRRGQERLKQRLSSSP